MAVLPNGVRINKGKQSLEDLRDALRLLVDVEVLAGFPEATTARTDENGGLEGITNASLAYIHDNGAPEANIPARPFMLPAMQDAKPALTDKLGEILEAVVKGKASPTLVEVGMHQVGSIAQLAIQNKINEGIPPPLSDRTLRARAARGRKGAQDELSRRKKGEAPATQYAKPLIDTGEMRKSANYANPIPQKEEMTMPQLDVSFMTADPMLADRFNVLRRMDVISDRGRTTPTKVETFHSIWGVVTRESPSDLIRRDDGQMIPRVIFVASAFRFFGPKGSPGAQLGYQPDQIEYCGSIYTVKSVLDYSRFGKGVHEVVAEVMEAP